VRHFSPSNSNELLSGILSTSRAPIDMRVVRNASAHLNRHNLDQVNKIRIHYTGKSLLHPTDLLRWETRSDRDFVFSVWLSDLVDIADAMTS
jgi:hypothetical protein